MPLGFSGSHPTGIDVMNSASGSSINDNVSLILGKRRHSGLNGGKRDGGEEEVSAVHIEANIVSSRRHINSTRYERRN